MCNDKLWIIVDSWQVIEQIKIEVKGNNLNSEWGFQCENCY